MKKLYSNFFFFLILYSMLAFYTDFFAAMTKIFNAISLVDSSRKIHLFLDCSFSDVWIPKKKIYFQIYEYPNLLNLYIVNLVTVPQKRAIHSLT